MAIQLKRGLTSEIDDNYVLAQGQIGIEMPQALNTSENPFLVKIGDGVTPWRELPYFAGYQIGTSAKFFDIPTPISNPFIFNGDVVVCRLNNFDPAYMQMSGDTTADGPGDFTVTVTLKSAAGSWWDGSKDPQSIEWHVIMQKTAKPQVVSDSIWTGESLTPNLLDYDPEKMDMVGDISKSDIGTYEITITPKSEWFWDDGTKTPIKLSWTVAKVSLDIPHVTSSAFTYNGEERQVTIGGYDASIMTQSGALLGTNAGTYSINYNLNDTVHYQWQDGTTDEKVVTWTINRASVTIPTASSTLTYNGSTQNAPISNYNSSYMSQSGTATGQNAGTYTLTYTLLDTENYMWSDSSTATKSVSWIINKATPTLTVSSSSVTVSTDAKTSTVTLTYNGDGTLSAASSNTANATVSLSGKMLTITGVKFGTTATITVSASAGTNYAAPANKTISVTCKAAYTITYYVNSSVYQTQTNVSGSVKLAYTPSEHPTTDYAYTGWSTSSSASTKTYTSGQTITVSSNLTLYAYSERQYYTKTISVTSYSKSTYMYFYYYGDYYEERNSYLTAAAWVEVPAGTTSIKVPFFADTWANDTSPSVIYWYRTDNITYLRAGQVNGVTRSTTSLSCTGSVNQYYGYAFFPPSGSVSTNSATIMGIKEGNDYSQWEQVTTISNGMYVYVFNSNTKYSSFKWVWSSGTEKGIRSGLTSNTNPWFFMIEF